MSGALACSTSSTSSSRGRCRGAFGPCCALEVHNSPHSAPSATLVRWSRKDTLHYASPALQSLTTAHHVPLLSPTWLVTNSLVLPCMSPAMHCSKM